MTSSSNPPAPHEQIVALIEAAPSVGDDDFPGDAPWESPRDNDDCGLAFDASGRGQNDGGGCADAGDPAVLAACAALDHSDTDNGMRLLNHFGADLAVVAQEGVSGGDFTAWCGTHWDLTGGLALATRIAQRVGGRIAQEAAFLKPTKEEEAKIERASAFASADDSEEAKAARADALAAKKALAGRRAARWRFAVTSKNKGRYENMLAAAAPHMRRPAESFNADAYKVACATHTLEFRQGASRKREDGVHAPVFHVHAEPGHRRDDWITALVPHDYDCEARADKWLDFIERMLPDPEKRRTVRAYAGSALTGVPLQRIMFHYGMGANGKSVFLETLTRVLGDSFAIGLPPESIAGGGERGAGGASPDIARLFGKRMVRVLELPEGKPLHEDLIKRLTGGEKFPVRTLFKGYFEFVNRAKPHMSGNGFPTIDGTDNGIWRRMLVVHWDQTIAEAERREFEIVVNEFVAEGPGILNWLIEGAEDFLSNGLYVAPAIREATTAYQTDMDPIGEFLAACVEHAPGQHIPARTLYEAYVSWSMANVKRPKTETKFGRVVPTKLAREDRRTGKTYIDCRLHDVPARPDAPAPAYPDGYGG